MCKLLAARIWAIDPAEVGDNDPKGKLSTLRNVDVVANPVPKDNSDGLPENPAHALIVTSPQIQKNNSAWGRVRIALARVATERGWALEPS